MRSIWPAELAVHTLVPARMTGRILVRHWEPTGPREQIVHTADGPTGEEHVRHRLRAVLRELGHPAGRAIEADLNTLMPAMAVPLTGGAEITALTTVGPLDGHLRIINWPQGPEVHFETVDRTRHGVASWATKVHDAVRVDYGPAFGEYERLEWEIADRDRWLAWAGIVPAEESP